MTPFHVARSVRSLNRLRHIAQVLTRHGFGHVVTRINLGRFVPVWMLRRKKQAETPDRTPRSAGERLAAAFSELGPTFIKLGQVLSTRPDLLPEEVIREFRKLQDAVPPFDTPEAMSIIEEQLGRPTSECFRSIEDHPMASASISQVYKAVLPNGQQVCVKVRRPGIEETIRTDMELVKWLAESLESLVPESRIYRPTMLVSELEQTLRRELDFVNEAAVTEQFCKAFADTPGIRIPKVYWECTGPGVLTIQMLGGINVEKLLRESSADAARVDRPLVAQRLADCFLKQALEVGIFHADPHPGNILVEPVAHVGLIDFGQIGAVTEEWKTELVVIVYAAVNREVNVIIDAFADMGAVGVETDRRSLHRSLQFLLEKYYGMPIKRFDLGTLLQEFSDVIRRHDIVLPRDLVLLIKSFSLVASVTQQLDPDLDLLALLEPRLDKALKERFSARAIARETVVAGWHLLNVARQIPVQLRQALRRMGAGGWRLDVRHENIDRLIAELDRSSNRLAFSIVIAAIIVGSSMILSTDGDIKLFGLVSMHTIGVLGYMVAGVLGLGLAWAIFRSGRLH